jgi:S-adenosylmethionine decarboxylase
MSTDKKIHLYGFNNLTKNLSFSLYRAHYLTSGQTSDSYHAFINEAYSSVKLTELLRKICHAIGGSVLNIASQDYTPQGASVTLMISEEAKPESLIAHLDKSHLCIHTYPEERPKDGVAIFRADIELSTCGIISPLKVLDYVIEAFSADVIDIDYRIRGMTRDLQGHKYFRDHDMTEISAYLDSTTLQGFDAVDSGLPTKNLYHCKLARKTINLDHHLFEMNEPELSSVEKSKIIEQLRLQLNELFLA